MKLVFVSDTHARHRDMDVPDGDIFIHCGDISTHGELETFQDFNNWLHGLPHDFKLFTVGNHDRVSATIIEKMIPNGIFLNDSMFTWSGIKFYGSPQTPSVWGTKEEYCYIREDRKDAKAIWSKIPTDTDVLFTHGPPFSLLDYIDKNYKMAGCHYLLNRVLKVHPKIHAFGHIHESSGIINQRHGIKFINCSILDGDYSMTNEPRIVNI